MKPSHDYTLVFYILFLIVPENVGASREALLKSTQANIVSEKSGKYYFTLPITLHVMDDSHLLPMQKKGLH